MPWPWRRKREGNRPCRRCNGNGWIIVFRALDEPRESNRRDGPDWSSVTLTLGAYREECCPVCRPLPIPTTAARAPERELPVVAP